MVVWPISPAQSDAPWYSLPSRMIPPPIPVPMVIPMALRRAAGRAHPPLAQHGAVRVVVQRGRQLQAVVDDLAQRQIHPAEIRGQQHDPALGVERSRRAHAHPDDLGSGDLPFGLIDGALGQRDQPVENIALAGFGAGRLAAERMQRRAVLGHAADDEVGATDVNSEDKSHRDSSALVTAASAAATVSTDRSRMQR